MKPKYSLFFWPMTITLSAAWLLCGFLVYGSTGHDDSHIHFWNVHTLLQFGTLENYNGDRIQQSSSLLQDLLTAALCLFSPLHPVTNGYWVDIVASFACGLWGARLGRTLAPSLASWVPILMFSSSSFLLWSFGGMGAPLTAFCLLVGMTCWWRWLTAPVIKPSHIAALIASTLALVLVRPEMPLVIAAIAAGLLTLHIRHAVLRARCCWILALTLGAAALLFFWQHTYFGSWLSMPTIAKQGGDLWPQLQRGTRYLHYYGQFSPVIPAALLCSLLLGWSALRRAFVNNSCNSDSAAVNNALLTSILLCAAWAYGGFIWTAGGDWMQAGRFLVPIIPLAALLLIATLSRIPHTWVAHILLAALTCSQLVIHYPVVASVSHGIPVWVQTRIQPEHRERYSIFEQFHQEHVRDMAVIDHLARIIPPLHHALQRPVRMMSGQAGMVFYYTAKAFPGSVQFRDLRGLVESSLTLCPLLRDIPRSPQGLFWGYRDFFQYLPALQQECGIEAPDIIYDLNDMTQKMGKTLEPLGYTLIHKETGFIVTNPTRLPYNRLLSPNMIFVRSDLLAAGAELEVINYNTLPLYPRY